MIDPCVIDLAKELFQIVKDTVGLHSSEQIKAMTDLMPAACPNASAANTAESIKAAYEAIFTTPL